MGAGSEERDTVEYTVEYIAYLAGKVPRSQGPRRNDAAVWYGDMEV